jgi:hypothetical protein
MAGLCDSHAPRAKGLPQPSTWRRRRRRSPPGRLPPACCRRPKGHAHSRFLASGGERLVWAQRWLAAGRFCFVRAAATRRNLAAACASIGRSANQAGTQGFLPCIPTQSGTREIQFFVPSPNRCCATCISVDRECICTTCMGGAWLRSAHRPVKRGRPAELPISMTRWTVGVYIDTFSRRTTHGSVTVSKIFWSVSCGVRPMWPPRGLIHTSFGSPAPSNR